MKPKEGEKYAAWLDRAKMYEQGIAMQRIAKGEDSVKVMEEMSRRLMEKALHPIFKAIRESSIQPYDVEKSRQEYEEKYLKNNKPVADHVDGYLFDNTDKR
jgi:glutamyl-tRNA reductase